MDRHPGPQPEDLFRRLRAWSVPSWRHADRVDRVRAALQQLADLGAAAAGRRARAVPELGEHALVDQLVVLTRQAETDGADPAPVLAALARDLGW